MASLKLFCEPAVQFNPEIHQNIPGFSSAYILKTKYNRDVNLIHYTGIEKTDSFNFIWSGVLWDFQSVEIDKITDNLLSIYSKNKDIELYICHPTCESLIEKNLNSTDIPEPNFIVSLAMIIIALFSLKRYRGN